MLTYKPVLHDALVLEFVLAEALLELLDLLVDGDELEAFDVDQLAELVAHHLVAQLVQPRHVLVHLLLVADEFLVMLFEISVRDPIPSFKFIPLVNLKKTKQLT